MDDPISITILLNGGEAAQLLTPATIAPYRPDLSADYAPAADQTPPPDLIGVPEGKIEEVDGATGAFTFSATAMPAGLKAKSSRLKWRGREWGVLKVRTRYWMGRINGFTLYLED
jgi:hypothetical protein